MTQATDVKTGLDKDEMTSEEVTVSLRRAVSFRRRMNHKLT